MPYLEVPINKRVFLNGERARTWNSALKSIPVRSPFQIGVLHAHTFQIWTDDKSHLYIVLLVNRQGLMASVNDVSKSTSSCEQQILTNKTNTKTKYLQKQKQNEKKDQNIPDYMGATGIQEIAFEQIASTSVVTPYGAFPMFLASGTPPSRFDDA